MRRTLTIDDDVNALLERENRKAHEPMKQTVNRLLRCGLNAAAHPLQPKRFVVKPLDTGLTRKDWDQWEGRKIEEILEEAEQRFPR